MGRAETLAKLIAAHGWTQGVELGLFRGETSQYLLDRFIDLHMFGCDLWIFSGHQSQDKDTGIATTVMETMNEARQNVISLIREYGVRFRVLEKSTLNAASWVPDRSVDFVFIDADHTTDAVMADIKAWQGKILKGGALLGHDANWPSVLRALSILNVEYQVLPGNVWISWR